MSEQENDLQTINDQQAELNSFMSYELASYNTVANLYEQLEYSQLKDGESKRLLSAIKVTIRNLESIKENASRLRRILARLQEKIEQWDDYIKHLKTGFTCQMVDKLNRIIFYYSAFLPYLLLLQSLALPEH